MTDLFIKTRVLFAMAYISAKRNDVRGPESDPRSRISEHFAGDFFGISRGADYSGFRVRLRRT